MAGTVEVTKENAVVSLDELANAILYFLIKKRRNESGYIPAEQIPSLEKDARKNAVNITNFFGYSTSILDNILNKDDRDPFNYFMDEASLLKVDNEEFESLPIFNRTSGRLSFRRWTISRIFYNVARIREFNEGLHDLIQESTKEPVIDPYSFENMKEFYAERTGVDSIHST